MAGASKLNTSHQHHYHGRNSMVQPIAVFASHHCVYCVHVMILLVFTLHKHYIKHITHTSNHRKPEAQKSQHKNIAISKPKIQHFEHPKLETKILSFFHPQTQIKIPSFSKSLNPKKKPNPQTHKQVSNKKRNFQP